MVDESMKQSAGDEALSAQLRATLDKAAGSPDPDLDLRLRQARQNALLKGEHKTSHARGWMLAGGFAVAASLAMIVVLPAGVKTTPDASPAAVAVSMPEEVAVEPEVLEDMDALLALGEMPDELPNGG